MRDPTQILSRVSSGIEPELVGDAEPIHVFGVSVPVARLGHLLALKVLAADAVRRPQDQVDIVELLRRSTVADVEQARDALRLITERGFNRTKNLLEELATFLEAHGPS